jgi:threonylcarbamoyladenosine tRNA methylthiotransferase MtaB
MMRTFSINTLGCKVNQYESQQIREHLEGLGLRMAKAPSPSDVVVVNTCCVTHTASAKSRQSIRQARRQSPNAPIIVSGCLPIGLNGELGISDKNVHLIRDRSHLAAALDNLTCSDATPVSRNAQFCSNTSIKAQNAFKIKHKNELCNDDLNLPLLTSFKDHVRAFLKVQDGCDGRCSYCIIPKTRPLVRSKPVDIVLREAQALVEAGHKEIVITGVFLGAYGRQTVKRRHWPEQRNDRLADLLDRIAKIPDLTRIRLSSLEPGDVTDRLLDTFCANPNIMPHLHLSLQSGSDAVLKRMCRQYRADEFQQKVASIKARLDRPAITTDIIVGFPGETDTDFEQTMNLAREVGFARIHVFSYSPRPGTPATKGNHTIDKKTVKERSQTLTKLGIELARRYRQQFIGETAEILIESVASPAGLAGFDDVVPAKAACPPPQAPERDSQLSQRQKADSPRTRDSRATRNERRETVVSGRSERYFKVYLDGTKAEGPSSVIKVKLIANGKDGISGLAAFDGAVPSKTACPSLKGLSSVDGKGQSAFSTTEGRQSQKGACPPPGSVY